MAAPDRKIKYGVDCSTNGVKAVAVFPAEELPLTKKELVKTIAEEVGLPSTTVREIVQRAFDGITETLLKAGRVELRNFGVFRVKERKPRKARNPRTGEAVAVSRKLVVTFKPGREMEERVRKMEDIPRSVQPAPNSRQTETPRAETLDPP
jgi:nucleoid DNA-binding protein